MERNQPNEGQGQGQGQGTQTMEESPIDETIVQVERLYRNVTGQDVPPAETVYAPIPAEKDPLQHVQEQVDRLLMTLGASPLPQAIAPTWVPFVSTWESDTEYLVCLDLPGVARDQVQVQVRGNVLSVSGTRPSPRDGFRLRSSEGPLGRFQRQMVIPPGIRVSESNARIQDGVLEIHIPKEGNQVTTPRQVRID